MPTRQLLLSRGVLGNCDTPNNERRVIMPAGSVLDIKHNRQDAIAAPSAVSSKQREIGDPF